MNKYSKESESCLATCHPDLQKVFRKVLEYFDHSVLIGHRGQEAQHKAFLEGRSKTDWPKSNHNKFPSSAVDVMPYPYSFPDLDGKNGAKRQLLALFRQYLFIGFVLATAWMMGIKIRSGADWDSDLDLSDQTFNDLPHFELKD